MKTDYITILCMALGCAVGSFVGNLIFPDRCDYHKSKAIEARAEVQAEALLALDARVTALEDNRSCTNCSAPQVEAGESLSSNHWSGEYTTLPYNEYRRKEMQRD